MRWILENIQLIIVIAGAVAWWLNQRAREEAGQEADFDGDGTPEAPRERGFEDPVLAERTRKIRDEIQRKIEDRRRGEEGYTMPAPRSEEPAPANYGIPVDEPPPLVREVAVAHAVSSSLAEARRRAEILEQQATLAERLKEAEQMKASAARRASYDAVVAKQRGTANIARAALMNDLKDADGLRRAFVLREVLGPPVSLR